MLYLAIFLAVLFLAPILVALLSFFIPDQPEPQPDVVIEVDPDIIVEVRIKRSSSDTNELPPELMV